MLLRLFNVAAAEQRRVLILTLLCLVAIAPAVAAAQESGLRRIEVTPFAAQRGGGSFDSNGTQNFNLDSSAAFGGSLGIPWSDIGDLEVWYSRQSAALQPNAGDAAQDVELQYLHVGGTYLFDTRANVVPFVVVTAGAARISPDVPEAGGDTFLSFGVGGGLKWNPGSRVGLRLDGRIIGTVIDSDSQFLCVFEPDTGSACQIASSSQFLWQGEVQLGVVFRF